MIDGSMALKGHPMFKLGIIDSYFHMDRLSGSYLTSTGSLNSTVTDSAQLIYGIANYMYMDLWCDINRHIHPNPCVRFTLGIHPHRILPNLAKSLINKLKIKLSQHPDSLGIGEVGLDYTTSCGCTTNYNYSMDMCRDRKVEEQKQFLRLVFQLFK